jgi:hypothetical protein
MKKRAWRPAPYKHLAWLVAAAACGGCLSTQLYDGPKLPSDDVARITGDPLITAGSPITAILRKVDDQELGLGRTSVEVLPGPHTLVVDCKIAETKSVSRHSIEADVAAGRHYRLRPESGPGMRGCSGVSLEETSR